jgi:hypothetical protein
MNCPRCSSTNWPNHIFCNKCRLRLPSPPQAQTAYESPSSIKVANAPSGLNRIGTLMKQYGLLLGLVAFCVYAYATPITKATSSATATQPAASSEISDLKAQIHWLKQDNEALRSRVETLETSLKTATYQIDELNNSAGKLLSRLDILEEHKEVAKSTTPAVEEILKSWENQPRNSGRLVTSSPRPSPSVPAAPYSTSYPPSAAQSYSNREEIDSSRVPQIAPDGRSLTKSHNGYQTRGSDVYVGGHVRKNGTYVPSYIRTAPNHTEYDNFGTKGNYNPYTGKIGTKIPKR